MAHTIDPSQEPLFVDVVRVRVEAGLREALIARARGQRTNMSEMVRRELRRLVEPSAGTAGERQP